MNRGLIQVTEKDMPDFLACLNKNLECFVPMLPYVEHTFHSFEMYKSFPKRGLYLLDSLSEDDSCLYHMYQLNEADSMLRATLVLPSSWDKRLDIMSQSVENLKKWLHENAAVNQFMIQCLEYGEIEYYPTLNHYLVSILLNAGFVPTYRMYMSFDLETQQHFTVEHGWLSDQGLTLAPLNASDEGPLFEFYDQQMQKSQNRFIAHCTRDEFKAFLQDERSLLTKTSFTLKNREGEIVGAIIGSNDDGKLWLDNLMVAIENDAHKSAQCLVTASLEAFKNEMTSSRTVHVYTDRHLLFLVGVYKACSFKPFEFWVDLIYTIQHR
jgi:hypothetical protein